MKKLFKKLMGKKDQPKPEPIDKEGSVPAHEYLAAQVGAMELPQNVHPTPINVVPAPEPDVPAVDKSLQDESSAPATMPEGRSRFPGPALKLFKCYLGHPTYGLLESNKIKCLVCEAAAIPVPIAATDVCVCGHQLIEHRDMGREECKKCGLTGMLGSNGGDDYLPKCSNFVAMA